MRSVFSDLGTSLFFLLITSFLGAESLHKNNPNPSYQEKTIYLFSDFYPPVDSLNEFLAPFHKKLIFKDELSIPKKAFKKSKQATYRPSFSLRFCFKEKPERLIFWNIPSAFFSFKFRSFKKNELVLFLWEPPTVLKEIYNSKLHKRFGRIYTWNDDLVDNIHYFKFYLPSLRSMIESVVPFSEKRLCTMVISNKASPHPQELYSKRKEIIDFFEQMPGNDFAFFGYGWKPTYRNYKGDGGNKIDLIKSFRFCFCLENMQGIKGYVTEKIFDAFSAGVVPIYLGASNITSYIPSDCFIDLRHFSSYEELYQFLKEMPEDTYNRYLERISLFLQSKEAALFSWENFEKTFYEATSAPAIYK